MAAAIDPDQPLPIYVQLRTILLEEILRGRFRQQRTQQPAQKCRRMIKQASIYRNLRT